MSVYVGVNFTKKLKDEKQMEIFLKKLKEWIGNSEFFETDFCEGE